MSAPPERAAWEAMVGDLDPLRSVSYDGITIEPLYTADDEWPETGSPGFPPFTRGRTESITRPDRWDVRQVVDAGLGRGGAVAELERGATSVWLRLGAEPADDLDGLVAHSLEGVLFDVAPVVLDARRRWIRAARALQHQWERQGADPTRVSGSLGADPFGEWASHRNGVDLGVDLDLDGELAELTASAHLLSERFPSMRLATIDGTRYHDAGASDAQELGFAVSAATATLRALTDETPGLDVASAFRLVELRLATTVDQFATIAKFRAARTVLGRLADVAGDAMAAGSVPLHAVTSRAMATRYDPAVNMLRSTIACFAAAVGGADAITVLPHDDLVTPGSEPGSERGRRLARNTQSVLAMESHLADVIDPAGGSWYVERLTDELAEAAWAVIQEIESAGGFCVAVEAGIVDEGIAMTRARRAGDVDHRRAPIIGVSEFPDVAESSPPLASVHPTTNFPVRRWSERFEDLRQRVDAAAASTGRRPVVFLATIGTPADFTAPVSFVTNFFGIAGLDTQRGPASHDGAEIAAAFAASGTDVACLCSSDAVYGEHGRIVAGALADAGASRLYVAGRARELTDVLAGSGITPIAATTDARAALAELLVHFGVA